jgi:hypothetical protein
MSTDQILDSIERDVVRKTEEARQALKRKQQIELKKEEPTHGHIEGEQFLTPTNTSDQPTTHIIQSPHPQHVGGQNVVQYVQVEELDFSQSKHTLISRFHHKMGSS